MRARVRAARVLPALTVLAALLAAGPAAPAAAPVAAPVPMPGATAPPPGPAAPPPPGPAAPPTPPPAPPPTPTPAPRAGGATAGPVLPALDPAARPPAAPGLGAALAPLLSAPALGPSVGVSVADAATGRLLYSRSGAVPRVPASVTKVATAAGVLDGLGPDAVLRTRVVRADDGRLVLVGGGDPLLTGQPRVPGHPRAASLVDLADRTARALAAAPARTAGATGAAGAAGAAGPVALLVDDGLFRGPRTSPAWKPSYVADGEVAPVSALSADSGLARPGTRDERRAADPAITAGERFAQLLRERGVPVAGAVRRGPAPPGAAPLAEVASPPVSALVERMLQASDNDVAEALARHAALAAGARADFAGGAAATTAAVRGAVAPLGADPAPVRLVDGSGLSRDNRLTSDAVALLLARAGDPRDAEPLEALLPGLPVAGFSGSLARRFGEGPERAGAGLVRAKTGTLRGVRALAGQVVDARGRLLTFAVLADRVRDPVRAQVALDRVAAAVGTCGCG